MRRFLRKPLGGRRIVSGLTADTCAPGLIGPSAPTDRRPPCAARTARRGRRPWPVRRCGTMGSSRAAQLRTGTADW